MEKRIFGACMAVILVCLFAGLISSCSIPGEENVIPAPANPDRPDKSGDLDYIGKLYSPDTNMIQDTVISDDGRFYYGSVFYSYCVAWYERNTSTGELEYLDKTSGNLGYCLSIALSPETGNRHLYAAGYGQSTIVCYDRNAQTGALAVASIFQDTGLMVQPNYITVSPDGKNVYALTSDNYLIWFTRDQTTGELVYGGSYYDESVLGDPEEISFSAGGAYVYVDSSETDSILLFERNPESGELTYQKSYTDGTWLSGITAHTTDPDGSNLYIVVYGDFSVGANLEIYDIDPDTGELYFMDRFEHPELYGAEDIAVSPDGQNVYALSRNNNALFWFDRNSATGILEFAYYYIDGFLVQPQSITISKDGNNVYVPSDRYYISMFRRD